MMVKNLVKYFLSMLDYPSPLTVADRLKCYCVLDVPKKLFLSQYEKLLPVEMLSLEEKIGWGDLVDEFFENENPEMKLESIKILYTIGNLQTANL